MRLGQAARRSRTTATGSRGGFTIIEMIMALLLLGVVLTGALGFMRSQNEGFVRGVDRMSAIQNLRYAFQVLELDVKTLGANLPSGQPALVYVADDVIAFSADYSTNIEDDVNAVYYDRDAPTGQVTAPTAPVSIPNSSFSWPDTTYTIGGGLNSPAELLIFYFVEDTSTEREDDYALYRQVNNATPELVARQLLQDSSEPFFSYYRQRDYATGVAIVEEVPSGDLPLSHSVKKHLGAADAGTPAQIDSVRAVQVRLGATNGKEGSYERKAFLSRLIGMPNAGQLRVKSCGDQPFGVSALSATPQVNADTGDPEVLLQWSPSIDETSGEEDVMRYILWRRPAGQPWGDPYLSIPAGQPSYVYVDEVVEPGQQWEYAIVAQDCTPTSSDQTLSSVVIIP